VETRRHCTDSTERQEWCDQLKNLEPLDLCEIRAKGNRMSESSVSAFEMLRIAEEVGRCVIAQPTRR
jgi:hypothetical protein